MSHQERSNIFLSLDDPSLPNIHLLDYETYSYHPDTRTGWSILPYLSHNILVHLHLHDLKNIHDLPLWCPFEPL